MAVKERPTQTQLRPETPATGHVTDDRSITIEGIPELSETQRSLELLLVSGVQLMSDILATARPEVFQKAAKVQRWARRLRPHLPIQKFWELDLAALLYPLGVISLPDDLAAKYGSDLPLTDEELLRVEESGLVASRLIANMPRMEGIARAVFYAHRGFDGSGWPKDGPSGMDLPEASRVLKVLIDLADEATGSERTREAAFKKLGMHAERYDPRVLKVAGRVLLIPQTMPSEERLQIVPALARPGDVLVHDLTDADGRLLLSAGTVLTELGARRLFSLTQSRQLPKTITVIRAGRSRPKPEGPLPDAELF